MPGSGTTAHSFTEPKAPRASREYFDRFSLWGFIPQVVYYKTDCLDCYTVFGAKSPRHLLVLHGQ
jgi:hypothetical protein